MQLLSLYSLIEIEELPSVLAEYFTSLGVATLEFLPNFFLISMPEYKDPNVHPENVLTNSAKYHPSLTGKNFLINIGNVISFYLIVLIVYPIVLLLGQFFTKLKSMEEKYRKTAIYNGLLFCFLEVSLSIFIQLAYVFFHK